MRSNPLAPVGTVSGPINNWNNLAIKSGGEEVMYSCPMATRCWTSRVLFEFHVLPPKGTIELIELWKWWFPIRISFPGARFQVSCFFLLCTKFFWLRKKHELWTCHDLTWLKRMFQYALERHGFLENHAVDIKVSQIGLHCQNPRLERQKKVTRPSNRIPWWWTMVAWVPGWPFSLDENKHPLPVPRVWCYSLSRMNTNSSGIDLLYSVVYQRFFFAISCES